MYIAEMALPRMRGQLVTINALLVTIGQFTAGMVDGALDEILPDTGWRYMLGLAAVPGMFRNDLILFIDSLLDGRLSSDLTLIFCESNDNDVGVSPITRVTPVACQQRTIVRGSQSYARVS